MAGPVIQLSGQVECCLKYFSLFKLNSVLDQTPMSAGYGTNNVVEDNFLRNGSESIKGQGKCDLLGNVGITYQLISTVLFICKTVSKLSKSVDCLDLLSSKLSEV